MAQILCEKPMFSQARNPSNVKFSQKTGIVSRNIELNETEERAQELRTTHKMHMPLVNAISGTTANRHPPPEKIDALHQLVSQSPRRSHAKPSQIPLPRRLTCSDLAAGSGRGGETNFANGQRCDDISEYGRCCYLYSLLKPQEWYTNKGITGFWEVGGAPAPIPAENFKDVLMAPTLIGMFQAGKFLPPQLNLVLELEFSEAADALRPGEGSTDYTIENVRVLASQVTLDSALYESYQKSSFQGAVWCSLIPRCTRRSPASPPAALLST